MLENEQLDDFKNLTDIELIKLYKNGNQTAFQQLAVRYIFIIRNKSSDLYNMGIESEDLFQEGLLGLHNAVLSFNEKGGASFRTYAGICIRNRLISAVRAANADKNRINSIAVSLDDEAELHSLPDTEPENAVIINENSEGLAKCLKNNLSETEISVLMLYLDGKSYDDIAKTMNIPKKSCDNAMQRVRKKLKAMY